MSARRNSVEDACATTTDALKNLNGICGVRDLRANVCKFFYTHFLIRKKGPELSEPDIGVVSNINRASLSDGWSTSY
jgi:hypothetical protein